MTHRTRHPAGRWRGLVNPFDLVVMSGAAVNLAVVTWLVAYWLLHGA